MKNAGNILQLVFLTAYAFQLGAGFIRSMRERHAHSMRPENLFKRSAKSPRVDLTPEEKIQLRRDLAYIIVKYLNHWP